MTFIKCKGCEEGDASDGRDGFCIGFCFTCMEENHFLAQEFIAEQAVGQCYDSKCASAHKVHDHADDLPPEFKQEVKLPPPFPVERERPDRNKFHNIPKGIPGYTNMLCPTCNTLTRWAFKKYERLQCTNCGRFEKREDVV